MELKQENEEGANGGEISRWREARRTEGGREGISVK